MSSGDSDDLQQIPLVFGLRQPMPDWDLAKWFHQMMVEAAGEE